MFSKTMLDRIRCALFEGFSRAAGLPSLSQVAELSGAPRDSIGAAYLELEKQHIINLSPEKQVWKAGPFSSEETQHRVFALDDDRRWFALCAWDAFGIAAMLNIRARIESVCGDCSSALTFSVGTEGVVGEGISHFALPARRWYDDLVLT